MSEDRKRVPPPRPVPDCIRFPMYVNGACRIIEVPKAHAASSIPFAPVVTFDMLVGGGRVLVTRPAP